MAEKIVLTTAEVEPSTSDYRIDTLILDWSSPRIRIELSSPTSGKRKAFDYNGPAATSLLTQWGRPGLQTDSLQKRVLKALIEDGKLSGSISGAPD